MIYFIQGQQTEEIKIGCTHNLETRLQANTYEKGEPIKVLAILDGYYEEETEIHRRFSAYHIKGDWFFPGEEILDFISSLKSIRPDLTGKEYTRITDDLETATQRLETFLSSLTDEQKRQIALKILSSTAKAQKLFTKGK